MTVRWTVKGRSDIVRLYEFLSPANPQAAAQAVQAIVDGAGRLAGYPRIGEKLEHYDPREVRRLLIGSYELRYEVRGDDIFVLRIWHTRENR